MYNVLKDDRVCVCPKLLPKRLDPGRSCGVLSASLRGSLSSKLCALASQTRNVASETPIVWVKWKHGYNSWLQKMFS